MSVEEGTIVRKRSFAQVPNDLITDTRLSSHAVRLWALLDRYAGSKGGAMPSRATLATDLGISEATVKRGLGELADNGWITRRRMGPSNVWETSLNERARVTGDPTPEAKRVTGDPVMGHGRPGNGSRVTRPRNDTGDVDTSSVDAADAAATEELDLGIPATAPNPVQVLVAAWVEAVEAVGGIAVGDDKAALGKNVKRLIENDGLPLEVVLVAVQRAGAARARNCNRYLGQVRAAYDRPAMRKAMRATWYEAAARLDGGQAA